MNIALTVNSAQSSIPCAYRTDITITSGNGITKYLLVKERIIDPDGNNDDTFVAVAGPDDIEELPELAPIPPSGFFRDATISLVSSDPNRLNDVVQDVLNDLLLTIQQSNDLLTFTATTTYTVDSTSGITPG